jgi:hypothetical protein
MQRYGFGRGTYRYLADPLPDLVRDLREQLYPPLASIANAWAAMLGERRFPAMHRELAAECAAAGQRNPTPLILHYGPGDHRPPGPGTGDRLPGAAPPGTGQPRVPAAHDAPRDQHCHTGAPGVSALDHASDGV